MRFSASSHHLKKTSLWESGNQTEADADLTTPDILNKATATIRASLDVNAPQNIWAALGLHLQTQLLQQNSMSITDFGTFGFNQKNEPIFVQDPVFLHMTRLCLASRKRGNAMQPAFVETERIHDIDFNGLAAEYLQNCSKDLVKSVISSVLAWVVSWAKSGQQMQLSFLPVGEWVCDGDSVDFRFLESFRKEVELKRLQKEEASEMEAISSNSTQGNNQVEQFDGAADQSDIASLSVFTSAAIEEIGFKNVKADGSLATAKEDATRSGSPVGHSRYKLRAPTFSSIAKQLPPHGQRRNRTDKITKTASNTTKANSGKNSGSGRASTRNGKQANPSLNALNADQIEDAANNIIAAMKNYRPGTAANFRAGKSKQRPKTDSHPTTQQVNIINRLRSRIINRRGSTLQGLNALVAVLKNFKTSIISPTQLSLSLRKLGVKISSAEVKEISAGFAHEKSSYIDASKLLDALRGQPLSGTRFELVTKVFHQMDPTCSGAVNIDEMIKHYDVGFLPRVRDGMLSRLEALTAFLQEWASIDTANTNTITFETFMEYYHNVSACINNDADFTRLMQQAWHIQENAQGYENQPPPGQNSQHVLPTTAPGMSLTPAVLSPSLSEPEKSPNVPESPTGIKRVLREETFLSDAWLYLRALLLYPHQYQDGVASWPTRDNMCRRLGANRVLGDGNETMNVKAFANALTLLDKRLSQKESYDLASFVATQCAESLNDSDTIVLQSLYRNLTSTRNDTATAAPSVDYNCVEYYASRAVERIRARVAGTRGENIQAGKLPPVDLNVLEKWLQVASSNGDSLLLKYELRGGLMKVGIDISYQDLDYLFAYFDVDRQGFISCDTFLDVLRNPTKALPKLANRQENTRINPAQKPEDVHVDSQQSASLYTTTLPHTVVRRKKQAAPQEPQPNFRRRNLIHRAIWGQIMKPAVNETLGIRTSLNKLEVERRRRYRAAQLIQTTFRGFRARQMTAQLRRKAAAQSHRFVALEQEQERLIAKKKKANRTILPSAYGF